MGLNKISNTVIKGSTCIKAVALSLILSGCGSGDKNKDNQNTIIPTNPITTPTTPVTPVQPKTPLNIKATINGDELESTGVEYSITMNGTQLLYSPNTEEDDTLENLKDFLNQNNISEDERITIKSAGLTGELTLTQLEELSDGNISITGFSTAILEVKNYIQEQFNKTVDQVEGGNFLESVSDRRGVVTLEGIYNGTHQLGDICFVPQTTGTNSGISANSIKPCIDALLSEEIKEPSLEIINLSENQQYVGDLPMNITIGNIDQENFQIKTYSLVDTQGNKIIITEDKIIDGKIIETPESLGTTYGEWEFQIEIENINPDIALLDLDLGNIILTTSISIVQAVNNPISFSGIQFAENQNNLTVGDQLQFSVDIEDPDTLVLEDVFAKIILPNGEEYNITPYSIANGKYSFESEIISISGDYSIEVFATGKNESGINDFEASSSEVATVTVEEINNPPVLLQTEITLDAGESNPANAASIPLSEIVSYDQGLENITLVNIEGNLLGIGGVEIIEIDGELYIRLSRNDGKEDSETYTVTFNFEANGLFSERFTLKLFDADDA